MSMKPSSADEVYWNESKQVGFDFNEGDAGFVFINEASKLSAHVKKSGALDNTELVHFGGLDELAGKNSLSPDSSAPSLTIFDNTSVPKQRPHASLSLEFKQFEKDDIQHIPPHKTARCLFTGQAYFLEQYKSKEEKLLLLDSAIKLHDGNSITAAVLFLEKTLKRSIFHQILMERPRAASHYINYLRIQQKHVELIDTLVMLQKLEDAAMIEYKSAVSVQQPEQKLKSIQRCWKNHFERSFPLCSDLVREYCHLLERQLPIEEEDARQERENKNTAFQNLPRTTSLLNMPVITTLYYCCLYHYTLPENHLASPLSIKKDHQLSNKQFVWTALAALTKRQMWREIDSLFESRSWLGGKKLRCCIGFDKAVDLLHSLNAPIEIVTKYLKLVDNCEVRLNLAKKCKCEMLVVDTLVSMGDRQSLESYKEQLVPHSKPYIYLLEALKASTIKWKN